MKKILKSLFIVAVLTVLVTGATRAVWVDPAQITDNQFTTGNADIKLADGQGSGWVDDLNTFTADEIYPGWTEDFTFHIRNESESPITLNIVAKLSVLWSDYNLLKDNLMLRFSWDDGAPKTTGEASLRWWKDNAGASLGNLGQSTQREYTAHFRLEDVNNNFQDRDLTFTVLLTGTQQ